MTRNNITLAATSGVIGLSLLTSSAALASNGLNESPTEDLQQFLTANPEVAAALSDVEGKTGGTVIEAEFDDDVTGKGVVEFEILRADGSTLEILYVLADRAMTIEDDEDDSSDLQSEGDANETDND